jgi:hypothetical protein
MYKIYVVGKQVPVECSDTRAKEIIAKWKENPASHEIADTDVGICSFKIKDIKSFECENPEEEAKEWKDPTGEFFKEWLQNAKQGTEAKVKQNKIVFRIFFKFVHGKDPTEEQYKELYYTQAKKYFDDNPYATIMDTSIMRDTLKDMVVECRTEQPGSLKFKMLRAIVNAIIKSHAWDKEFMNKRMKYEEAYGN